MKKHFCIFYIGLTMGFYACTEHFRQTTNNGYSAIKDIGNGLLTQAYDDVIIYPFDQKASTTASSEDLRLVTAEYLYAGDSLAIRLYVNTTLQEGPIKDSLRMATTDYYYDYPVGVSHQQETVDSEIEKDKFGNLVNLFLNFRPIDVSIVNRNNKHLGKAMYHWNKVSLYLLPTDLPDLEKTGELVFVLYTGESKIKIFTSSHQLKMIQKFLKQKI